MDISRLRQKINRLDARRRRLLGLLMHPDSMIRGSAYQVYKKCGNPRCRCARGEKHGPFWYLSVRSEGSTRMVFIRRADERRVVRGANRYRHYQQWMAEVRKINEEIFRLLRQIRDSKLEDYS